MRSLLLTAVIGGTLLAGEARAWYKSEPLFFGGYEKSSVFVRGPEKVGGVIGFIAGGIVTVPVFLVTQNFGDPGHYVYYACEGGNEACSFLVGVPFWLVEGVFWRWPRSLFSRKANEDAEQQGGGYSPPAARSSKPTP